MAKIQHVFGARLVGHTYHTRRVMSGQPRAFVEKETSLMYTPDPRDYLPDIRDGLTHRERADEAQG